MKKRRILCALLAFCAALAFQAAAAADTAGAGEFKSETAELAEAGTYADKIHWSLDGGVLTISPEGEADKALAMPGGKEASAYDWSPYADQITKVIVTEKVSSVGDYAFQGCEKLESVELSADVTAIGKFSFAGCSGAVSLSLGPSIGTVGVSAFQDCASLETLTLTGTLGSLDAAMLEGCAALKSVTLTGTEAAPLSLKDGTAFRNCPGLEKITISGPASSLGANLFALCDSNGDAINAKGSVDKGSREYLPTALSEADLSGLAFGKTAALPSGMFSGCTELKTVKLPEEGLAEIGAYCFMGCESLVSMDFPAGLASIGDYAFQGCPFTSIRIPEGLTAIGKNTFENCAALTSVSFPAGVNSVGDCAFKNCDALASVKFPRTGEKFTMGKDAFAGCDALVSASLHLIRNPKFALPDGAFQDCHLLSSLTLPDGLTTVGNSAFQACNALESVVFPKNVTSIGKRAFSECTGLRSIDIKGSNVLLDEEAFSNCISMTAAIIPEGVVTINEHAFQYCEGMKNAVIPSTVKTVSPEIFFRCSNLEHVYYPGGEAEWKAIKDSDKLQEKLSSRDYVNMENTLVLEWDMETTPVSDGYSGSESGGEDTTPVNPGEPENLYGDGIPAKITDVTAGATGVSAKVLGNEDEISGAVLFAAAYGSTGISSMGTGTKNRDGTYQVKLDISDAIYVRVFLLKENRPIAERAQIFV